MNREEKKKQKPVSSSRLIVYDLTITVQTFNALWCSWEKQFIKEPKISDLLLLLKESPSHFVQSVEQFLKVSYFCRYAGT